MNETHTNGQGAAAEPMDGMERRLREDLGDFGERAQQLVQEYPITTIVVSMAVGYLLARLASRL